METRRTDIAHGRARLATQVTGGNDATVLLLHAGVTDQRSWGPLVDRLSAQARCVSFDRRGFGETTYETQDGWSPVDDAVAVLDGVGVERAVVVGASIGGETAIDLALAHPDRVAGLVLIGPAVSGSPPPEVTDPEVLRLDADGDAALERGDPAELNRIEATLWLDGPARPGRVTGAVRELFLAMNARALAAAEPGEEHEPAPAWDRLAQISAPTLVLVGDLDLEHIRRNTRHLAGTIPGARLVELAGVAHLPHLEGDERTLAAIERFVGDRPPRRIGEGGAGTR